jgi:ferredoxin
VDDGYNIEVFYENQSCNLFVHTNETILAALERDTKISDTLSLPNHMIPSDCRRGNCLTCTGKLLTANDNNNNNNNNIVTDDGLAPGISEFVRKEGYIVTCSSYVVGDGVQIVLGENHNAWTEIYKDRVENDQARFLGWAAMARSRRLGDEKNVPRWKKETETVLKDGVPTNKKSKQ